MATGAVKIWHDDRGFGFIEKDDGGDIFAHLNDVAGRVGLIRGERVQFDEGADARNGKRCAKNITPLTERDR